MNRFPLSFASFLVLILVAAVSAQQSPAPPAADAPAAEQPADSPADAGATFAPYVGTLTGDNVYVRSGAATNYYPIVKLKIGAPIRVVGEKHGWLQISPPKGCFSFIDKTFVDTGADGNGVINGDHVWVRAASLLPSHSRMKYAKQVRLDKGAIVTILGETDDGFYKIAPPKDVAVWVSGQFVARTPDAPEFTWDGQAWVSSASPTQISDDSTEAIAEAPTPTEPADETAPTITKGPQLETDRAAHTADSSKPAEAQITAARAANQALIDQIEKDLDVELQKKLKDRRLEPFIERFQPIARQDQNADEVSVLYAQNRIQQLQEQIEAKAAVLHVTQLASQLVETRQRSASERDTVLPIQRREPRRYDVRGMLTKSFVFTSPVGPKRYRIIDPSSRPAVTLAYIEVPQGKQLDEDLLLGRYVGIRASGKRIQQGVVRPVPVFLVDDVDLLGADEVKVAGPAGSKGPQQIHPGAAVAQEPAGGQDAATVDEEGPVTREQPGP